MQDRNGHRQAMKKIHLSEGRNNHGHDDDGDAYGFGVEQ